MMLSLARILKQKRTAIIILAKIGTRARGGVSTLWILHSPDATGLSVHALPAIVDSSTAPVNSRSRPRAVPGTRCTRRSPIIAVPDGREGARPASRLRLVPRERACFSTPLYHPLSFPATRRRLRDSRAVLPRPGLRLNPAHLSLINR